MRRSVHMLKEESKELRGRLRNSEKDAFRKDKLLQEILDKARGGPGVSGEHLDQIREDLAVLLQYKRRAQDQKAQLEERDQTIAAIERELKVTRVIDLEEEIVAAKQTARAKARLWAERHADTHCHASSEKYQKEARKLIQQKEQLECEVTGMVQRQSLCREQHERLVKQAEENARQIGTMKRKTAELAERREETVQKLEELVAVPEQHEELSRECDAMYEELQHLQRDEQLERRRQNMSKPQPGMFGSGKRDSGGWTVAEAFFAEEDFCPLQIDALESPSHRLLWRLRHVSCGVLEELGKCDENEDGLLTQGQLLKGFKHLRIAGSHKESILALWEALHPCLKRDYNQLSYVELYLGLQRLPRPSANAPLAELQESALPALVSACRRSKVSEAEFKGRLLGLLDPSTGPSFQHEAVDLCAQLGVPAHAVEVIVDYIDLWRAEFALSLPMWSTYSDGEASTLLDNLFKMLREAGDCWADQMIGLTPDRFRDALCEKLPPDAMEVFSSDEVDHIVFLLGEASPFAGQPQHLDGEKIFQAAMSGTWRDVFPDLFVRLPGGGEEYDDDFDPGGDSYDLASP